MIVGIDASNLRAGGGVTHLIELLRACDPAASGFSRVIVWGGRATLSQLEARSWLELRPLSGLDRGLIHRILWQRTALSKLARESACDVLFVPGGSYSGRFRPIVTMSRNLLPFEWRELRRFGWSWMTLKLLLLRFFQTRTLRRADGVIFLTDYAYRVVNPIMGALKGETVIIPHGISDRFSSAPPAQDIANRRSLERPLRLLYVSIIDVYKHQWHVVEAVAQLRAQGASIALELIGPAYPPALRRLKDAISRFDPGGKFITYSGSVPHTMLHERYARSDICVFASSCENMPNILLEGMASGLPVACSSRGPMPEVLGDAGVFFDPEDPTDIARALGELIASPDLRATLAQRALDRVHAFSWTRCARETFGFLKRLAERHR